MTDKISRDSKVMNLLAAELKRQKECINLIAAENYASKAVLQAQGSVFTNKYAEGYPENRYYPGCIYTDGVENLAIERAKTLYKAEHANVQPHSGSQANMAAYFAVLQPGDTVMGMSLADGGHLTHGAKANFSGKWYNFVPYGLNRETELLDYDEVEKLAMQHKPKLIMAGASSYPRIIDFKRFNKIAKKVGAYFVADMAHIAGLVAAGLHPSPVPVADIVTSSSHKTLRGPRSGFILCTEKLASSIDNAVFPTMQGGPQVHAIAGKAIAFYEAMQPAFVEYQKGVLANAIALAEELKRHGLRLVTGGTENHLMLIDLTKTGHTGLVVQQALEEANILANRNAIPFDKRSRQVTSGVRFGTPAATSRGLGAKEMKQIGGMIAKIIANIDDKQVKAQLKEEVISLCQKFPAPGLD